jgi:hypothetical protein
VEELSEKASYQIVAIFFKRWEEGSILLKRWHKFKCSFLNLIKLGVK